MSADGDDRADDSRRGRFEDWQGVEHESFEEWAREEVGVELVMQAEDVREPAARILQSLSEGGAVDPQDVRDLRGALNAVERLIEPAVAAGREASFDR